MENFDKALNLKANYQEAWNNKGSILNKLKRHEEAIAHFDVALSLKPDYAECWSNKAHTLNELKQFKEALAHSNKAIAINPNYAGAFFNKGVALNGLKLYEAAMDAYETALKINPDTNYLPGELQKVRMFLCNWKNFHNNLSNIIERAVNKKKSCNPFICFALVDNPEIQKICAEVFATSIYPKNDSLGSISSLNKKTKIRIGYFSSDFRHHAVSFATVELFELHDKNQFEIFAFSFGHDDQSQMRKRVMQAFDQFIDVSNKSDEEIAILARDLGIDIAINLNGFTDGERTGIFSYRAAPIQVSYIGYLGTMGLEYIDYLIADEVIIPKGHENYYSEKIVFLPYYQSGDSQRKISEKIFTRQDLGLPETGFIFAAFNNNYKILPSTFSGWMRILEKVKESILWVYVSVSPAIDNIKAEAIKHGVDSNRIIFAQSMSQDEHLARYSVADLFLDTYPCNGGSTVVDALWAGLPVLTLTGNSFASRVAASSLKAIHLPELISYTQEEYESLAIELAINPDKFSDIKTKLASNRFIAPLFNTPLFIKNLESAYIKMHDQYETESPLDHILI